MGLKFNSLVLIPSDHCNISCRHCYPECGPKLKGGWNVELLKHCISDAATIPGLNKMIHFAGGEPFLYRKAMLILAEHAASYGFRLSIVTNGFWGKHPETIRAYISRLSNLGLCRVELSADRFHQEHIPITSIKSAIKILKEHDVGIVLRVVTTRSHMIDETLRLLDVDDLDGIEVIGSPMVPIGRALTVVHPGEHYRSSTGARGSCWKSLNLTIRPDGNVSPCCAGSDVTPSLSLGNIHREPLPSIVARAEWNYLIQKLVHQGPASFFPLLEDAGLGIKIKHKYTNICHACTDLFSDTEVTQQANRWLSNFQKTALAYSLKEVAGSTDTSCNDRTQD